MYQDTVTLFNRSKGINGDVWYPTILENVNVNVDKGVIVKTYGDASQDNAVLNVKYQGNLKDDTVTVGKSIWVPPKIWQRLNDKTGHITFSSGSAFDFFWCGKWPGGVAYDDNYGDISFFDYMLSNFDFCFSITNVGYFSVIPHFEITGR